MSKKNACIGLWLVGLFFLSCGCQEMFAGCISQEARVAKYDLYFNEGIALMNAGDHKVAIKNYHRALKFLPNDPAKSADAYNNLGWSLAQLGKNDEAVAAFEKAIQLRPDFALATNNLNMVKSRLPATPGK